MARYNPYGRLDPRIAPTLPVNIHDIIWFAGVYEGDGSCSWTSSTQIVTLTQKDAWLPLRLRNLFGGSINKRPMRLNPKFRSPDIPNVYQWYITGARARGLLMSIYGLLSPRQKQIRKVLSY